MVSYEINANEIDRFMGYCVNCCLTNSRRKREKRLKHNISMYYYVTSTLFETF